MFVSRNQEVGRRLSQKSQLRRFYEAELLHQRGWTPENVSQGKLAGFGKSTKSKGARGRGD
jgi:hypothetical protein